MEPLIIKTAQKQAPEVDFDPVSGVLNFSGQCYLDNAEKFFRPIREWLNEYLQENGRLILFEMQLDYFNTSSAKCLWDLFIRLEKYVKEGKGRVVVHWYFDDDDDNTWDLFEDFKAEVSLEFVHINSW